MIERGGPEIFKFLPVFPDVPYVSHAVSTPAMIHRPSRRLLIERALERLASPVWRMLGLYGY